MRHGFLCFKVWLTQLWHCHYCKRSRSWPLGMVNDILWHFRTDCIIQGHGTNQTPRRNRIVSAKSSFWFLHCLTWHRSVQAKLLATHWHDGVTQSLLHEQDRNSSTACGPMETLNQSMESCKSPSWSTLDHPCSTEEGTSGLFSRHLLQIAPW